MRDRLMTVTMTVTVRGWPWQRPWPRQWLIVSPVLMCCQHLLVKRKAGIHTSRLVMFTQLSCMHAHQEPTSTLERVLPSMEYAAPTAHACCVENKREVAWCARISITTRLLQPANQGQVPLAENSKMKTYTHTCMHKRCIIHVHITHIILKFT